MITKVGAKILGVHFLGTNTYTIDVGMIKTINNTTNALKLYGGSDLKKFEVTLSDNVSGSSQGIIALVGVGNTAVTADDYCLDEMTVGGVDVNTIVQCTGARLDPSLTIKGVSYLFTFTNRGESAVTIKEICICYRINSSEKYMIARKVIPPRTIQPDETATFDYVIDWF